MLHGEISGIVTDAATSMPVGLATVIAVQSNDTTQTDNEGKYLFKNLVPADYDIKASKSSYAVLTKSVTVIPAETKKIDFSLAGVPIPKFSRAYLNYGLDSTTLTFTISNIGRGRLTYVLYPSQNWISVHPVYGNLTSEIDTVTVTVNKTGLPVTIPETNYKETIIAISIKGTEIQQDTIDLYINGLLDGELNFYKVVRIGMQIWMAENLNTGTVINSANTSQTRNEPTEKYCYLDNKDNCQIYGGIYQWDEMMNYQPSDSGLVGTTKGVCPDGWHIPTQKEWLTLIDYLGGDQIAGGKLKESGTAFWLSSPGTTNESGFSGLPGGMHSSTGWSELHRNGYWWTSTGFKVGGNNYSWALNAYSVAALNNETVKNSGLSVRCVKDQGKK